ncbi:MAG: L(+)-tartrate dehydratase subunit alpha [Mogibacterium sp.]|nr:L(+)-tartrate dehydratase subunit alpha [Mogibacterium sp.]MBQ6502232.1 L(+)-tartrate dehydratase subunit alpha [Mogibacterium sp.]
MTRKERIQMMTDIMASFIGYTAVHLPDDVISKLRELRDSEEDPAALSIYDMMFENMRLASELGRPSCQDTGFVQLRIECGSRFPLIDELEEILRCAVITATNNTPLRPNVVETFDEINTGNNTGTGAPSISWKIVPGWDGCGIYTYLAGGGCSLPGHAAVLMPGEGYKGVVRFVLDRIAEYGTNACPPLYVGVGIANSVDTAAMLSKEALFRPLGSHSPNEKAAEMERMLEDAINTMGIGPQGMGGKASVLGVSIQHAARHTATLGVGVSFGCWTHRRGHIVFERDLSFVTETHPGFTFVQ